jgi:hypothetical protein
MDIAKKYATALLGLLVFIAGVYAIRTSGLLQFAIEPQVESGSLKAIDASWILTLLESVISIAFTVGMFVFGRIGESTLAALYAMVGWTKTTTPAKTNGVIVQDVNGVMRKLYEDYQTKRTNAAKKAIEDIDAAMKTAVEELRKGIK